MNKEKIQNCQVKRIAVDLNGYLVGDGKVLSPISLKEKPKKKRELSEIKEKGFVKKAMMFFNLPAQLQNDSYMAVEFVEHELNSLVERKDIFIRNAWWIGIDRLLDRMKYPIMYEIAKSIKYCGEQKYDFGLYVMTVVRANNRKNLLSPGKCLNDSSMKSMFRKLFELCDKDIELVKSILNFYDYFLKRQKEVNGVVSQAYPKMERLYRVWHCVDFEGILDAIRYCIEEEIGYLWYIDGKIKNYMDNFDKPDNPFTLYLKNLTNDYLRPKKHQYDLQQKDKEKLSKNPWKAVIEFLQLDSDVEFVDGSIPKGFEMSLEHIGRGGMMNQIVTINKEGYYYTKSGDRFKGQRHHQVNGLHVVSCNPSNFVEFKESWWDLKLRKKSANVNELKSYGLYKDRMEL